MEEDASDDEANIRYKKEIESWSRLTDEERRFVHVAKSKRGRIRLPPIPIQIPPRDDKCISQPNTNEGKAGATTIATKKATSASQPPRQQNRSPPLQTHSVPPPLPPVQVSAPQPIAPKTPHCLTESRAEVNTSLNHPISLPQSLSQLPPTQLHSTGSTPPHPHHQPPVAARPPQPIAPKTPHCLTLPRAEVKTSLNHPNSHPQSLSQLPPTQLHLSGSTPPHPPHQAPVAASPAGFHPHYHPSMLPPPPLPPPPLPTANSTSPHHVTAMAQASANYVVHHCRLHHLQEHLPLHHRQYQQEHQWQQQRQQQQQQQLQQIGLHHQPRSEQEGSPGGPQRNHQPFYLSPPIPVTAGQQDAVTTKQQLPRHVASSKPTRSFGPLMMSSFSVNANASIGTDQRPRTTVDRTVSTSPAAPSTLMADRLNQSRTIVKEEFTLLAKEILPPSEYDDLDRVSPLQADSYARTTDLYPDETRIIKRQREQHTNNVDTTRISSKAVVTPPPTTVLEGMMRPPDSVKEPPRFQQHFPLAPKGRKYNAVTSSVGNHYHHKNRRGVPLLPYTNGKSMQLDPEQIQQAIPENASCIFHILDRRVNLDALPPSVSMYALIRAWVQDDPYRQVPPSTSQVLMYGELFGHDDDGGGYHSSANITRNPTLQHDHDDDEQLFPKQLTVIPTILDRKRKVRESMVEVKVELGHRARMKRKQANDKSCVRQRQALKRLQAMGIKLK